VLLGQSQPLGRAELQPQLGHDALRNFVLEGEQVINADVERIAPECGSVAHAKEGHIHAHAPGQSLNGSVEHRLGLQLMAGFQWI
jgi:hypothetical protein